MSIVIPIIISAVLAIFTSITAPIILSMRTERLHRADQERQFAREDHLESLMKQNARNVSAKLEQIHTLVNSEMTAARQNELDQTRAMLSVLQRVVAKAYEKGIEPEPEDLQGIKTTRARVSELESILADRLVQLRLMEKQAAEAEADGTEGLKLPADKPVTL